MSIDFNFCIQKILEFHSSARLAHSMLAELQFNEYIYEMIGEKDTLVFLISSWRKPGNVLVRALGKEELPETIFFLINEANPLYETITKRTKVTLPTEILNEELQKQISLRMKTVPKDFHCIAYGTDDELPDILYCIISSKGKCGCLNDVRNTIVEFMLRHCGNTLGLSLLQNEQARLYKQSFDLLTVAEHLFKNLEQVSDVVSAVMHAAQKLVNAERCSLFLVDQKHGTLTAKVFDGAVEGKEVMITIDQGIAGHVAHKGEVMNVHDVYSHPLFYSKIDEMFGFKTRNMLCIPILSDGQVIAVAQLCNKIGPSHFTPFDEEIAGPFATYCGISIKHTILYQKVLITKARQKLTNELMTYHLKQQVTPAEKRKYITCQMDHRSAYHYESFSCSPLHVDDDHTICVIGEIFDELEIVHEFEIPKITLLNCLLYMKRGYRDNPYHNWAHAFSVIHFGYLLVRNFRLIEEGFINKMEALAFLVACIGHDMDHRGTTNSFQSKTGTALASLYSSQGSVMERHHFQQTMCVLHMEDCNIFENIGKDDYKTCVDIINHVILATDLATHFKKKNEQAEAFAKYNKENPDHKNALLSIMVTSADLSMQTKDWHSVHKTVKDLYEEFFTEGDLETAIGGAPNDMMDRKNAKIPQQQIQFLDTIVLPVFNLLNKMFSESSFLLDNLRYNYMCWSHAVKIFRERLQKGQESLLILSDETFEKDVLASIAAAAEAGGESS